MARATVDHDGTHSAPPNGDPFGAALPAPVVEVYLWPDNVDAWQVWCAVQTQWRTGVGGATGLDYAAVAAYLTECALHGEPRRQIFDGIRAAESAFLDALSQRRERQQQQQG